MKKFSSLQEEIDYKTKKLQTVLQQVQGKQAELDERNEDLRRQREELYKTVADNKRTIELKKLVFQERFKNLDNQ